MIETAKVSAVYCDFVTCLSGVMSILELRFTPALEYS